MPRNAPAVPFHPSHPDALAVYCSDGRFTRAVEALLEELGYARLDTLTIPGGPGLLDLTSADHGVVETVRTSVSFLVTGHEIAHVVLIAHEGCGYYRARLRYESPDSMVRRQLADLRGAERWLRGTHGKLEVGKFYARVAEGRVHFDPVE
jgi:hypothetical protein